jgi:MFS family permease
MSRKTLLVVIAVLAAIFGFIGDSFGLTMKPGAAVVGLGSVLLYVFFEAKADKQRMAAQRDKWKDPKFWIAAISAGLAAAGSAGAELPISPEIITTVLTVIMGVLFKTQDPKTA